MQNISRFRTLHVCLLLWTGIGSSIAQVVPFGMMKSISSSPILSTTNSASSITYTSAVSGGNVSGDGGKTITSRGICWSKTSNPTIDNFKTVVSGSTGSFTSNLTNLSFGTRYYIRAYATNSIGTSYGTEISFTTTGYSVGESALGGKIAYILVNGDPGFIDGEQHGLVAKTTDVTTALDTKWDCYNNSVPGADGIAIGTGNQNTIDIVTHCSGAAALICYNLVEGGYSDWFLPSMDELNKLFRNRASIGGFSAQYYWTSTEVTAQNARWQHFGLGGQQSNPKNMNGRVRAVRAF